MIKGTCPEGINSWNLVLLGNSGGCNHQSKVSMQKKDLRYGVSFWLSTCRKQVLDRFRVGSGPYHISEPLVYPYLVSTSFMVMGMRPM